MTAEEGNEYGRAITVRATSMEFKADPQLLQTVTAPQKLMRHCILDSAMWNAEGIQMKGIKSTFIKCPVSVLLGIRFLP